MLISQDATLHAYAVHRLYSCMKKSLAQVSASLPSFPGLTIIELCFFSCKRVNPVYTRERDIAFLCLLLAVLRSLHSTMSVCGVLASLVPYSLLQKGQRPPVALLLQLVKHKHRHRHRQQQRQPQPQQLRPKRRVEEQEQVLQLLLVLPLFLRLLYIWSLFLLLLIGLLRFQRTLSLILLKPYYSIRKLHCKTRSSHSLL